MKKHYNVKENHPNWKGGKPHCVDCNKVINYGYQRCKSCSRKGKLHFRFKGGIPKCKDCNKKLGNYNSVRCKSCARKGKNNPNYGATWMKNKGNPNWRGGLNKLGYSYIFNNQLKEFIRKRDNYICQNCGKSQKQELKDLNRKLDVHHIDYNKNNCKKNNLIALCHKCNIKANYNRDYWYAYFIYLMRN